MGDKLRQNPFCIVVGLTRQGINVLGFVFLIYCAEGNLSLFNTNMLLLMSFLAVGYGLYLALRWWVLTYTLTEDGIEISGGVLLKYRRDIPRIHVQLVETESSVIQRLLGLCSLKLETQAGNNNEAQATFSHLSIAQAEQIKQHLEDEKVESEHESEQEPRASFRLDVIELINYAVSSGAWTYGLAFLYAVYRQLPDSLAERLNMGLLDVFISNSDSFAISFIFAACFVLWIACGIWQFVRYYGLHISTSEKDLRITYGLLHQYCFTVPLDSIKGIQVKENIGQQLLGIASVYIEVNRGIGKGSNEKLLMIPSCQRADLESLVKTTLPDFPFFTKTLKRPPTKALHRYIIKKFLTGALVGVALAWLLGHNLAQSSGLIVVCCVTAISAVLGFLSWKYSGFALSPDAAMVRSGGLGLTTIVFPKSQVKAVQTNSHLLQRRAGLVNLCFRVSTGKGKRKVAHILDKDALAVYAWLDPFSYMILATPPDLLQDDEPEPDTSAATVVLNKSWADSLEESKTVSQHPVETSSSAPPM